jgi:hypothetical protein
LLNFTLRFAPPVNPLPIYSRTENHQRGEK